MSAYSLDEHRHRFATWAAARAAQRSFTSSDHLVAALNASGIREALADPRSLPTTAREFDEFHWRHCDEILDCLRRNNIGKATYGRAAKLLAIYLKSMVLMGDSAPSAFAKVLHPPLDRILLHAIAADEALPKNLRATCRGVTWTTLDAERYFQLIDELRAHGLDQPAFWMLERYWQPAL